MHVSLFSKVFWCCICWRTEKARTGSPFGGSTQHVAAGFMTTFARKKNKKQNLAGGFNPSEKYIYKYYIVSWGYCSQPPTRNKSCRVKSLEISWFLNVSSGSCRRNSRDMPGAVLLRSVRRLDRPLWLAILRERSPDTVKKLEYENSPLIWTVCVCDIENGPVISSYKWFTH